MKTLDAWRVMADLCVRGYVCLGQPNVVRIVSMQPWLARGPGGDLEGGVGGPRWVGSGRSAAFDVVLLVLVAANR
jgi:hypothetical protein